MINRVVLLLAVYSYKRAVLLPLNFNILRQSPAAVVAYLKVELADCFSVFFKNDAAVRASKRKLGFADFIDGESVNFIIRYA